MAKVGKQGQLDPFLPGSACLLQEHVRTCSTLGLRVSWERQDCATPGQWALVTAGVMGKVLVQEHALL